MFLHSSPPQRQPHPPYTFPPWARPQKGGLEKPVKPTTSSGQSDFWEVLDWFTILNNPNINHWTMLHVCFFLSILILSEILYFQKEVSTSSPFKLTAKKAESLLAEFTPFRQSSNHVPTLDAHLPETLSILLTQRTNVHVKHTISDGNKATHRTWHNKQHHWRTNKTGLRHVALAQKKK